MNNIDDFIFKFNKIKEKGWLKTIIKGNCGVGRTFEYYLGNQENSLEIPDYNGIEIKTKVSNKNLYTTLFNCKPESNFYNETERLKDTYGYSDKLYPNYLVLNNSIFCNKKTLIGNKYYFKLEIDKKEKKIFLNIFDLKGNLIEKEAHWDFDTLEEKLFRKLKILAYINASKKYELHNIYFRYNNLKIYKLKNFDNFIYLIEKGKIRITFKIGIYKKGTKFGKTYDHGTGFDIRECDLLKLYDRIY